MNTTPTTSLFLCSCLLAPVWAQEPPSPPPDEADEAERRLPEPEVRPPRELHLLQLSDTIVHFDFAKAPLEDVVNALARATGVPFRIGERGRKDLHRRGFRIKYVASQHAIRVLDDVVKHSNLEFELTDDGVVIDHPRVIKELRQELGLPERSRNPTEEDVTRALTSRKLSVSARGKALGAMLAYLRQETGVTFVRLDWPPDEDPRVSLSTRDLPLGELLDRLTAPADYAWVQQKNVILVGPAAKIAAQGEARAD